MDGWMDGKCLLLVVCPVLYLWPNTISVVVLIAAAVAVVAVIIIVV